MSIEARRRMASRLLMQSSGRSSSRRALLKQAALGTAGMMGLRTACARAAANQGGQLLTPLPSHQPAKAKRLIFVFLTGGFSHVDTFDPKPRLATDQGKSVSAVHLRG